MLILDLPPTRGNSFRAVDSTHGDTDPCQMIHVCLANNQIFCLFRLTNLCPLPPPGKPTHTGQFMVLPFIFFLILKLPESRERWDVQPFAAGCESRKPKSLAPATTTTWFCSFCAAKKIKVCSEAVNFQFIFPQNIFLACLKIQQLPAFLAKDTSLNYRACSRQELYSY